MIHESNTKSRYSYFCSAFQCFSAFSIELTFALSQYSHLTFSVFQLCQSLFANRDRLICRTCKKWSSTLWLLRLLMIGTFWYWMANLWLSTTFSNYPNYIFLPLNAMAIFMANSCKLTQNNSVASISRFSIFSTKFLNF